MSEQERLREDALRGRVFHGFRLDELIGQGGMAYVYKATSLTMGSQAAVKILFSHLSNQENIRLRFLREAKIQHRIEHKNVVRVLNVIQEAGLVGLIMDWIDGGDLGSWLDSLPSPPDLPTILLYFIPLLEGLGVVHEQGIVHRDIKPLNILIQKKNKEVLWKIADFGIAKDLTDDKGQLTGGHAIGTPLYMSPEQLLGKPINASSDIYSLGVTLYQLLSKRTPLLESNPWMLLQHHIEGRGFPSLTELGVSLPPAFEAVLATALSKEPEQRFPDALAFAEALRPFLPAQPKAALSASHALFETPLPAASQKPSLAGDLSSSPSGRSAEPLLRPPQLPPPGASTSAYQREEPSEPAISSASRSQAASASALPPASKGSGPFPSAPETSALPALGETAFLGGAEKPSLRRSGEIPSPHSSGASRVSGASRASGDPGTFEAREPHAQQTLFLIEKPPSTGVSILLLILALGFTAAAVALLVFQPAPEASPLRKVCEKGQRKACFRLAWLLENESTETSQTEARRLYQDACEQNNDPLACDRLSLLTAQGRGGNQDLKKAEEHAKKACRLGTPYLCSKPCLRVSRP